MVSNISTHFLPVELYRRRRLITGNYGIGVEMKANAAYGLVSSRPQEHAQAAETEDILMNVSEL